MTHAYCICSRCMSQKQISSTIVLPAIPRKDVMRRQATINEPSPRGCKDEPSDGKLPSSLSYIKSCSPNMSFLGHVGPFLLYGFL